MHPCTKSECSKRHHVGTECRLDAPKARTRLVLMASSLTLRGFSSSLSGIRAPQAISEMSDQKLTLVLCAPEIWTLSAIFIKMSSSGWSGRSDEWVWGDLKAA